MKHITLPILALVFSAATLLPGCASDDEGPREPSVTHQNPNKKTAVKYAPQDVHEKKEK